MTGRNDRDPTSASFSPTWPRSAEAWSAFAVAGLTGIAIWTPAMAAHPRYSRGPNEDLGSSWFWNAMIAAALILGAVFARNWRVIAIGLVLPQLVLAPWTTPRGDNDGLWGLVLPFLVIFGVVLHVVAGLAGSAVTALRRRGRRRAAGGRT
jgi:hypothetical protein